jgi:hypothetical protein
MSRESRIEFDRNYCTHYKPQPGAVTVDYCALGCGASGAMDRARKAGEPNMSPCLGGHRASDPLAICPKWERRSLEHAEKRADAIQEMLDRMEIVGPAVIKWRVKPKPASDRREVIECPKCHGKLHLHQSSYNGHVRGHCETKDCVSWME